MLSMALWIRLDHTIVGVSNWEISNRFYRDVVGAEIAPHGKPPRVAYRLGDTQLNVHGPGLDLSTNVARLPVQPGNSDLCFRWPGPIEDAIAHLAQHGVEVETGPVARLGAKGQGISVYFRDPDGSLVEFISYEERDTAAFIFDRVGQSRKSRNARRRAEYAREMLRLALVQQKEAEGGI